MWGLQGVSKAIKSYASRDNLVRYQTAHECVSSLSHVSIITLSVLPKYQAMRSYIVTHLFSSHLFNCFTAEPELPTCFLSWPTRSLSRDLKFTPIRYTSLQYPTALGLQESALVPRHLLPIQYSTLRRFPKAAFLPNTERDLLPKLLKTYPSLPDTFSTLEAQSVLYLH